MTADDLFVIEDKTTLRIVRKIADGGMGTVYEAVQDGSQGFHKSVAVKTLLATMSAQPRFVDMFVQEAKLVAGLVHENIVQIYQLGQTEQRYYIVMELVHGLSLAQFIRLHVVTKTALPRNLAVFIASRVARGLSYAHSRRDRAGQPLSIVHRDVCPNNILITTEGLPKITDFGIAQAASNVLNASDDLLLGKAVYMAPEQAARQTITYRCDMYALGAVLFELLTGTKIRPHADDQDIMIRQAVEGVVDWAHLPDDLEPEIRHVLVNCLARDPEDRYATTAELARDLEYFIYKDGYGPTIQTLEAYMREQFRYLYREETTRQPVMQLEHTLVATPDATLVIEQPAD